MTALEHVHFFEAWLLHLNSCFEFISMCFVFPFLAPPIYMFFTYLCGRAVAVDPIATRGADYTHHSTTSPPGISDLATGLMYVLYTMYLCSSVLCQSSIVRFLTKSIRTGITESPYCTVGQDSKKCKETSNLVVIHLAL